MPIPAPLYASTTAFQHSRLGTELGQAWFRFRFAVIYLIGYLAYITFSSHVVSHAATASVITYLLFSLFWLLPISKGVLQTRMGRVTGVLGDQSILSLGLYFLGDLLAPMIWAPATVSIGYGFRYGFGYAKFSIAVAATFVGAALLLSPVWTATPLLSFGILFGTVLVPWYAIALSEHLAQERSALAHRALQLETAAKTDILTGIANRAGFTEALNAVLSAPLFSSLGTCAVFAIDLDGFKAVNDRYGHQCGDQLLEKIAEALVKSSRDTACIARYGGDEFCILIPDAPERSGLERYASRLLESIALASAAEARSQSVTASIGVYVIARNSNLSAQQVMQRADALMYEAKKAGKNQFRIEGV